MKNLDRENELFIMESSNSGYRTDFVENKTRVLNRNLISKLLAFDQL
jgi:hypothetical protein